MRISRWRKYDLYCAGPLGDLVPHRLLPIMFATGNPQFPTRVTCIGSKPCHTDKNTPGTPERDCPEHVELLAEFPNGMTLVIVAGTVAARSPGICYLRARGFFGDRHQWRSRAACS